MTANELICDDLCNILIRLANVRASIANEDCLKSQHSMSSLAHIDSDLERWASAVPPSWALTTAPCVSGEYFYRSNYHRYPSAWISFTWTEYRVARCIVNDLLLSYFYLTVFTGTTNDAPIMFEQQKQARAKIAKICDDICDSVPYLLGYVDQSHPPKPGSGAIHAMWALFVCACMQYIPQTQRTWAINQLERIGHEMGVHQTLPLADLMKRKVQLMPSTCQGVDSTWEETIVCKSWYEKLRTELFLSKPTWRDDHLKTLAEKIKESSSPFSSSRTPPCTLQRYLDAA